MHATTLEVRVDRPGSHVVSMHIRSSDRSAHPIYHPSIPFGARTAQAALYLRAFNRLAAEGRVVRERVLAMMYVVAKRDL